MSKYLPNAFYYLYCPYLDGLWLRIHKADFLHIVKHSDKGTIFTQQCQEDDGRPAYYLQKL